MLFAGEHPVRYCLSLLILLLEVLLLGYLLPSDWFVGQWTSWAASEQFAYFSSLWAVQATLAALVYPIVIAFVTVFLQRRPASEAFLHLYILDSGALVAGLSSLTLVVAMAAQYVLLPTYGISALPVWVSLDAVWFLLNAALTTFFLYRTIEFLRPETQQRSIHRYAINTALPRDVARLNSFQALAQAQSKQWIPAPNYLDDTSPDGPKVMLYGLGFREGSAQGTRNLHERSRLHDVRLWPLRLAVLSWVRAASRQTLPKSPSGPLTKRDAPRLTFPLTPGREYENRVTLAYVDAGPPLKPWQRLLIRWSFVFRPVRRETYGIKVSAMLSELEADAREAAAKRDVPAFERAYENLVGLHELLLGASLVVQEDGSIGSWALLPDTSAFFDETLYRGWANTYRSIFQAAIDAMANEVRPIRRLCHLVQHLDGDDLQTSPVDVRVSLMQLPPLMMYQLGTWWTHRVEEQGIMDHGPHYMAVLRPPLHRVYEEVLSEFASGWESTRDTVTKIPELDEGFDWSVVPALTQLNAAHITETARMLLGAVNRGDQAAAEWLADILSKWWGKFEFQEQPYSLYGKTSFLTIEMLKQDWAELHNELSLSEEDIRWAGGTTIALQRGVLLAALQNFWTDIRLLVLEILLSWLIQGFNSHAQKSLALEIAGGLLVGKQWRQGGTSAESLAGLATTGYLTAKARQYASGGHWRHGYISLLDKFVERVKDMERPDMISSRIYSFSGADDVESLGNAQLILLGVLSDADWVISDTLRRQLDIWMLRQHKSIEILQSRVTSWLDRIGKPEPYHPIVPNALAAQMGKMHDYEAARQRTLKGLESLRNYMEKARADALEAEPIDDNRIQSLASFASKTAFSKETGKFPLCLFPVVEGSRHNLEDFVLSVNQVRKGELTRVELEQRAGNEEWWAALLARPVSAVVMADVLRACKVREISASDASSYWNVLKTEAARIKASGMTPVLVLNNATKPEWVWQWQHGLAGDKYQRPAGMSVQKRDGRGAGYLCDFDDIEVYVGPVAAGQSLLLAQETFKSVSFQMFGPERYVDISAHERSDTKLLYDLKLKFSRRVHVGFAEAVRIVYTTP